MKKTLFLIAVAFAFVACSTKENIETQVVDEPSTGKVTLKATMPAFETTKASIDNLGNFAWALNDEISVVYTDGTNTKSYIFKCTDATTGSFTSVDDIEAGYSLATSGTVAYYPKTYNGTPSNQEFATLEEAAKGFQMHAINDGGNLKFAHDNAMLYVSIDNVPSFAEKLNVGAVSVTIDQTGDIVAFVPMIETAAANLTVSVTEGSNTILTKTTTNAVAINAAKFYDIPDLEVGRVITFDNQAGWDSPHVSIWNGSNNWGFAESNSYPSKLNKRGSSFYYIVLNSEIAWISGVDNIGVYFAADGDPDDKKTETARVYLDRDLNFTIPDGGGLRTSYRVYLQPDASFTSSTCTINFWYGDASESYGMSTANGLFYFTFSESYYGNTKHFRFIDSSNAATNGDNQWYNVVINQDHYAIIHRWGEDNDDGRNLWLTDKI